MYQTAQQESGRSMIEMPGVLAIIGVLSVGGIAGYSQAMSKFKVTKTTDQIQTMVTNIRTLFAAQKNYASVDTDGSSGLLYSVGILTDENCPDGGDGSKCKTPVNPYSGPIKIAPYGTGDKKFYVAYGGLPADACVRLATQSWGDASSGLIAIHAGQEANSTITNTSTTEPSSDGDGEIVTKTSVQMNLASASKGCGTSGETSAVTLFYK